MKKFFRMVTALSLACGAFAFTGCNKDYTQDIEQVRTDLTSALETQNKELTDAIDAALDEAKQYADAAQKSAQEHADAVAKEEAAAALEEAKAYADEALATAKEYADNAAAAAAAEVKAEMLEEIKDQVEDALAAAKSYADEAAAGAAKDALDQAKAYVDQQVAQISGRIDGIDTEINTLKGSIDEIEATLGGHADRISALEAFKTQAEKDLRALEAFQAATETTLEEMATTLAQVNEKLGELGAKDTELQGEIDSLREEYTAKMEEVDASIEKLNGYVEDIQADIDEINSEIDGIISRMTTAESRLDAIDNLLESYGNRITDAENRLTAIEEDIKEINENILSLSKKIGERLTSISLIPELYVDGVPAIGLPTIVYNAITVVGEQSAVVSDEYYAEPFGNTVIRYNLSPSHVTENGIGSYEYLIERSEMITKSYVDNKIINIDGIAVNDRNELEVSASKVAGISMLDMTDDQLDEYNYKMLTAALRLGVADELLLEGETDAFVTSEYSAVLERPYQLHITPLKDLNQEIEKYSCGKNKKKVTFSTAFEDAKKADPSAVADYDKEINLLDMVSSCAHSFKLEDRDSDFDKFFKEDSKEIDKERMAELGFAFRFALPEEYKIGPEGTNEQDFAMFKDESNTVLISKLPDGTTGNKAAIGRTPIVRVELIDLNNENAIVDVQWFKIKWVEQEIPATPCGLIKTFDYTLSCVGFKGSLTWDEVNTLILAKVGENGIDHETFENTYCNIGSTNDNLTWTSEDYTTGNGDLTAEWTWNPQDTRTTVFTWALTIDQIGEVADDILASEDGYITYTINVKLAPRAEKADFAGDITFSLAVRIKLPELPKVTGYTESFWAAGRMGELAPVTPVGYEEAVVQGGDENATVKFNYSIWNLFNPDANDNIVTLMNPEDKDLKDAWDCRAWDMQFSAEQSLDGYAPAFTGKYAGEKDNNGYSFLYNGENVSSMTGSGNQNWYKNENILDYRVDLKANEGGIALLNDINDIQKTVNVDIWARINKLNAVKVHTYQIAYINPLSLVAPKITASFTDDHNKASKVDVSKAFDGLKDFQGYEVTTDNDRARYYGVKTPVWDYTKALVNLVIDENNNKVVDPDLDGTKASDRAKMMPVSQANYNLEMDATTLTFRNQSGNLLGVEQTIWIPVIFEHTYGKVEYWVSIPVKPHKTTPGE